MSLSWLLIGPFPADIIVISSCIVGVRGGAHLISPPSAGYAWPGGDMAMLQTALHYTDRVPKPGGNLLHQPLQEDPLGLAGDPPDA